MLMLIFGLLFGFVCAQDNQYLTTCSSDQDWNRVLVAEHLKYFLTTFNSGRVVGRPKNLVVHFDNNGHEERLDFVARIEKDNRTFGWKAGGHIGVERFHDGFLYGAADKNGDITGDKVVFLYPDFQTALVGQFEKDVMIAAQQTKVVAERCRNGIKEIRILKPRANSPIFKFQRPTRTRPGDQPTVADPYEKKLIFIADGVMQDGVFAKRNIRKGELISYYAGIIFNPEKDPIFFDNQTKEERYAQHRNLIRLSHDPPEALQINVPIEYWNVTSFRATLGHKFNHSFTKSKAGYAKVSHPRFGMIMCIVAMKDIMKGDEIFVKYNYPIGSPAAQSWYRELYEVEVGPWPSKPE